MKTATKGLTQQQREGGKKEFDALKTWQKPTMDDLKEFAYQHAKSHNTAEDVQYITGLPLPLVQRWFAEFN